MTEAEAAVRIAELERELHEARKAVAEYLNACSRAIADSWFEALSTKFKLETHSNGAYDFVRVPGEPK